MPDDIDDSDEDLGKSLAAMLAASQAYPRMIQAMRALSSQFHPRQAADDNGTSPCKPPKEPLALLLDANAMILARAMESWKQWQDVVSEHVPRIADHLEAYTESRREGVKDVGNQARNAVVDAFRSYARELAQVPERHGKAIREDLVKLTDEYLATDTPPNKSTSADSTRSGAGRPRSRINKARD